jgi:hypothetical protein
MAPAAVSTETFVLRCADVHPVICEVCLGAPTVEALVSCACDHGAHAHGFTPNWYDATRVAAIKDAATTFGPRRDDGARFEPRTG